jgi:hypothetical protein
MGALVDLCKVQINSIGPGPLSLGQAVTGFRGVEALQDNNIYSYSIIQDGQYEVGEGTYTAFGATLSRSPLYSSNGNTAISVAAGAVCAFTALSSDITQTADAVGALQLLLASNGGASHIGIQGGGDVQGFIQALATDSWALTQQLSGSVSQISDLAGLLPMPGRVAYLTDYANLGQRAGFFLCVQGTLPSGDPLQGLYFPSSTTGYYWSRIWNGVEGQAEWFGAKTGDSSTDYAPAINAAIAWCPTLKLRAGDYYTNTRILVTRNGQRIIGAGMTQTDEGTNANATRILCQSATATIMQVGVDGNSLPATLTEAVQLADFTVQRTVGPTIPASGFAGGAVGIAVRWAVNCHFDRVFSLESAKGWEFYGTVEMYTTKCSALRSLAGTTPANDFHIGYYLDYSAPLGTNGGNASLYFDKCRAFPYKSPATLAYSSGIRSDGGFVDLYIDKFEMGAGMQYGIHLIGDAYSGGISYKTEDLMITNCVLDPGSIANIRVERGDISTQSVISNNYCAPGASGTAISLFQLGGTINVSHNQIIGGGFYGTGISANQVNGLVSSCNLMTRILNPIVLNSVTAFTINNDRIHGLEASGTALGAVVCTNCTQGVIEPIVDGPSGCYGSGIYLTGTGNSRIEARVTNLQYSAFVGGAAQKLLNNNVQITSPGPFGNNCTSTGIN